MVIMEFSPFFLYIVIIAVVAYDFTNGFHDAPNMLATAIASHSVSTATAISIAIVFTFLGPLLLGVSVADTIGTFVDITSISHIDAQKMVISALFSAILFNIITWLFGVPSSSSNALAGGLVGAGLYYVGSAHINWGVEALRLWHLQGFMKVLAGLLLSPLIGLLFGALMLKLFHLLGRFFSAKATKSLKVLQLLSIASLSFSHGANDAQKGMAIIAMMLLASHETSEFSVPLWTILLCTTSITVGTLFGGWRIIKMIGYKIFHVKLLDSINTLLTATFINLGATAIGAPTSTSQVVTATLVGDASAQKPAHIHWRNVIAIVSGWALNLPTTMLFSFSISYLLDSLL